MIVNSFKNAPVENIIGMREVTLNEVYLVPAYIDEGDKRRILDETGNPILDETGACILDDG